MKYTASILFAAMLCMASPPAAAHDTVDLSGTWSFQLDDDRVGERERWFEWDLKDEISLPGSTDEARFGVKAEKPQTTRLTREYRYVGPAWYQKTIEIPESWEGKHVELFLERAMWETKVWLDNHYLGMQDSLCVPHRFDLSDYITPGHHRLTLRINNRLKVNVGHEPRPDGNGWSRMWAMSLTEESQGNWNGVIGGIGINVKDPVRIERVEVLPDLDQNRVKVIAFVRSDIGAATGELTVSASCGNDSIGPVKEEFSTKGFNDASHADPLAPLISDLSGTYLERRLTTRVELSLPFTDDAKLWDEFSPNVHALKLRLRAEADGKTYRDEASETFGLRKFIADGKQFKLNGRTVFVRGNQDNCIHPRTAYPPMDKAAWLVFLQKHKDYGLNCMRFHSWCPPKAAFQAADELGMFVHVEGPVWDGHGNIGDLPERAIFLRREFELILDEYGNHPSFVMMATGNELGGGTELYLQHLVEVWRKRDKRHLYTATCQPANQSRNDDFFVSAGGIGGTARGLQHANGRINFNYEETTRGFKRPFISHEIGQYTSFPDFYSWFNEEKYTGPLKAPYIGMLKNKFETNHPAERGPKFAKASGALQVLFYKTEIEAMLRTPAMAGFHLNGLMDYPGEGIALIGMLDAMGDSKGLATPEEFRRFCSETVALTAIKEQNLASGSLFEADALVRHHGPEDIDDGQWLWSIADASGKVLLKGDLGTQSVATGGLTVLGKIEAKLPDVTEARELTLALWMAGSEVKNDWQFWVYPAKLDLAIPEGVVVADLWGPQVKEMLQAGGRVLLMPDKSSVVEPVDIWFWNIFWGRGLFPSIPRPMGIYCDPAQPALAQFPTRDHSQFQWYSLLTDSYAITMNELPFDFEPVVFMIDDFNLSHRLGMVLEAKVGKGRLLINTLNLGQKGERTLAQQQMLNSLLVRVGARDFAPTQTLTPEKLDKLLYDTQSAAWLERSPNATIIEVSSSNPGMEKEKMQDGNTATFWHTRFAGGFAKPPHYVVLKIPGGIPVTGLSYFAYRAGNGNGHVKAYSVYVSNDGKNWGVPLMKGALQTNLSVEQQIRFPAPTTRNFIKFEVTDAVSFGGQPIAAVGELDVILK